MMRGLNVLSRWPKARTQLIAVLLASLVGWFDYLSGFEFEVTAFYLLPICWAAWASGRKAGLFLAVTSAILTTVSDLANGRAYRHPSIAYWNSLMLLAVFVVAAYAVGSMMQAYKALAAAQVELREANEGLEQKVQRRTAELLGEISARQRLEQEKLKAERLLERQEKLATLGTLTAGIAHEIRNPLTSLKARLYTLEKHLVSAPAARKDTEIIGAEIARLDRIVQDALSFARPADPRLEPIAASDLLREVHGLMATTLETRGIQLIAETASDLRVRVDRGHIKQVLINLVRNAAEAIETAGTITLRAFPDHAQLAGKDLDVAVLEVRDTGKGIPPQVEGRLFDPFFSTKETGTGLGLPIAARIVEKHGGRIEYETKPGHGTAFRVVLPREIAHSALEASG